MIHKLPSLCLLLAPACCLAGEDGLPDNLDCRLKTRTLEVLYPEKAAKLALEGRVLVDVDLAGDGSVTNPVIVSSDPTPRIANAFDATALRLVQEFRCRPRAPSILGADSMGKYRISVVFELAPGGRLLAHPASDKQFRVLAEDVPQKPPRSSATRISR